jgi:hypothetical protein
MLCLPSEIVHTICSQLTEVEKAFLSFTSHDYRSIIPRRYSLLDSCIISRLYKWMRLAEDWHNVWTRSSYVTLGKEDNLGFFTLNRSKFSKEGIELVLLSAVHNDKIQIIQSFLFAGGYATNVQELRKLVVETALAYHSFNVLLLCIKRGNGSTRLRSILDYIVRNRDCVLLAWYLENYRVDSIQFEAFIQEEQDWILDGFYG